jgi:hypothetical protein
MGEVDVADRDERALDEDGQQDRRSGRRWTHFEVPPFSRGGEVRRPSLATGSWPGSVLGGREAGGCAAPGDVGLALSGAAAELGARRDAHDPGNCELGMCTPGSCSDSENAPSSKRQEEGLVEAVSQYAESRALQGVAPALPEVGVDRDDLDLKQVARARALDEDGPGERMDARASRSEDVRRGRRRVQLAVERVPVS